MIHGWPAIQMVSLKTTPNLTAAAGNFDAKQKRFLRRSKLFVNSHRREFVASGMATQFWSDINRWPGAFSADGSPVDFQYQLNSTGLVINIGCLTFAFLLVMLFCEYRIGRFGTLLRFSIFEFLILFSLFAIGFGWVGIHHRRAQRESVELQGLLTHAKQRAVVYRYNLLPTPVSRLFDYVVKPPFVHVETFRPVRKFDISTVRFGSKNTNITTDMVNSVDIPLSLFLYGTAKIEAIADANVYELTIDGNSSVEMDLDKLKQLKRLRRLTIRNALTPPETEFDCTVIDSIANLEKCKLIFEYYWDSKTGSPAKHIHETIKLENVDEFELHVDETTLNELLDISVNDKRVILCLWDIDRRKNSKLIKRLLDAGYVDRAVDNSLLGF